MQRKRLSCRETFSARYGEKRTATLLTHLFSYVVPGTLARREKTSCVLLFLNSGKTRIRVGWGADQCVESFLASNTARGRDAG